jgi:hypothetical protein
MPALVSQPLRSRAAWTGALLLAVVAPSRLSRAEAPTPAGAAPAADATMEERVRQLEQRVRELSAPPQPAARPPASEKGAPPPAEETSAAEPFAWGDFSWLNGGTRQTKRVIDSKYFTPQVDVDVNYTYSFNHPIDNTVVGSTALARNNELELSFLGFGGDAHIGNVRARLMLQLGTRSTVVPRNDGSILRGQFDLQNAYRYISEGYAGYHFDWLHGVNVDLGIFMSYVGLFSYDNFENWAYQPSFTSDNTPWFFNGARIQIFPTDRLKVELWIINGWQTYGKFNELPGAGYQIRYAPREWLSMVFNGYVGTDTQDHPGRVRVHSDNSLLGRYYNHPESKGLSRAAFSVTFDLGIEQGDGVQGFGGSGKEYLADGKTSGCTNATPCEQNFISGMAYNRLWFDKNLFGWTVGGGFIHNPGRYLVLVPTGVAAAAFDTNSGTAFDGWDVSTTFDWMPSENLTFRLEGVHRESNVPYFAGRGGVTGPNGYKTGWTSHPDSAITTQVPMGWTPDLVKSETRLILALLFRI